MMSGTKEMAPQGLPSIKADVQSTSTRTNIVDNSQLYTNAMFPQTNPTIKTHGGQSITNTFNISQSLITQPSHLDVQRQNNLPLYVQAAASLQQQPN